MRTNYRGIGLGRGRRLRGDGGFSLLEVMIALTILSGVAVTMLSTISIVETRNRETYRWNVAHMAAQHTLSTIEASAAINGPGDLLNQHGALFEIDDGSFLVDESAPESALGFFSNRTIAGGNAPGRVFVYDMARISDDAGRWETPSGSAYLIRVSIDMDNDQDWRDLDIPPTADNIVVDFDRDDVNVYGVIVF